MNSLDIMIQCFTSYKKSKNNPSTWIERGNVQVELFSKPILTVLDILLQGKHKTHTLHTKKKKREREKERYKLTKTQKKLINK